MNQISLRAARVNADLTQDETADKLGINVSTYIKWEKEPWRISALRQKEISETFDIPIDMINFLPND